MTESNIPELTLDPNGSTPQLSLDSSAQPAKLDENVLSPEEQQAVESFAQKIDLTDSTQVLNYGVSAQQKVASFSETALNSVRNKDLGEIGNTLTHLVAEVKGFDQPDSKKGLLGRFQKEKDKLTLMRTRYNKVENSVEQIAQRLEEHQRVLLKDIATFDQLYDLNVKYFKELTMYILAGQKRLEDVRSHELVQLHELAQQSGQPEDAQKYNDLVQMCNRFEKKLHDLELTRMVSLQMGPQTRLVQNNDMLMVEKIQSSLVNTIPLWKSQMLLALGLEHSRQATAAQSAVTQATNDLLRQNADLLKMGTLDVARESERGIVDIETLQHTNTQLIATIDEVLTIQRTGAEKRKTAELELRRIEGELKQKLLELRG